MDNKITGWIYSLWSGVFRTYEGYIQASIPHSDQGRFITANRSFQCSIHHGVVFNAVVWLSERDDDLARELLVTNELHNIDKLREKIENHQSKINILKEGPVHG